MQRNCKENAWPILLAEGFNVKKFNENYNLYYRSTRYTPANELIPVILDWIINRNYNYNRERGGSYYEVCCTANNPHYTYFLWNSQYWGEDCLLLERKLHYEI